MDLALIVDERNERARSAAAELRARRTFVEEGAAHVWVVVGGDGHMLRTLHRLLEEERSVRVYGLNLGTVGFLMNRWEDTDVTARIEAAEPAVLHPLEMRARRRDGAEERLRAINEVSLFRASAQTAKLRVRVDGDTAVDVLLGDGVLVSTAAGSTAYNRSAGGPIIPLGADLLAVTPIAPFRPRGWKGALLPGSSTVCLEVLDPEKRPVQAAADSRQVDDVIRVDVREQSDAPLELLFDPGHGLEARILREQFAV